MNTLTLTKTPKTTETAAPAEAPLEVPAETAAAVETVADEMLLESAKRAKPGRVKGGRSTRTVRGWSMGGRVD